MNDLSGSSFGRYHLVEKLGEGGMAVVYKAFDTRLECDVAVKVIRMERLTQEMMVTTLKRFEREAKAVAQLTHANIVKVTDFGENEGTPYLVMEYLPGGTIKQFLGKSMPYIEAAQLLAPIARALNYAHSHNVIHRDVKPSNILITESGEPMLTDFGIAKILDLDGGQTLTGTGVGIGTPEYMAPEQWTGNITPSVDIYSLGVVFYELVTGHKPYTADTPAAVLIKLISDPLPQPTKFIPGLPEKVEQVIFKALARKPEDRYQSMEELGSAFENMVRSENTPANISEGVVVTTEKPESSEKVESSDSEGTRLEIGCSNETSEKADTGQAFETGSTRLEPSPKTRKTETPVQWIKKEDIFKVDLDEDVSMEFIRIPAGMFLMGSNPKLDPDAWIDEQPQHEVFLDEFWIAKTSITRKQFQVFARQKKDALFQYFYGTDPVKYIESDPFTRISWATAVEFCEWIGSLFGKRVYLPTEAQWEKAARGKDGRIFPWGNDYTMPYFNKPSNIGETIRPMGFFPEEASPYGVLGMSGVVWEWLADWYSKDYYQNSPLENPTGPSKGKERVLHGGYFDAANQNSRYCRSAYRMALNPKTDTDDKVGFRCVILTK